MAPEGPCVHVPVTMKTYTVVLPYARGILEKLRRVCRSLDILAYFKPTNTLQQLLVWPNDKVEKGKIGCPVYYITCDDCDATYVGKTERSLKTRFFEHRRKGRVGVVRCQNMYT